MTEPKLSEMFGAWLETTNDSRPLSDYKTVLRGHKVMLEQVEARLEPYEQREAGNEFCEAHEAWLPIEKMHMDSEGVWLCQEAWDELVKESEVVA